MQKTFRAAKVRAASYDEEAGTIQVIWTTGAAVRRVDWDGTEYNEILSLDESAVDLTRLNSGAPLLDSHQDGAVANVVGVVVEGSARIEEGRGIATVLLSKALDVANIVRKIVEGVVRNISVGYVIDHSTRSEGDPPTVLVDHWTPLEISAVPIPADPGATIRSAGGKRPRARQTPAQRAAAYTNNLLRQSSHSAAQARGAAEARKLVGGTSGPFRVERAKPATLERFDLAAGAHEARKLLRK